MDYENARISKIVKIRLFVLILQANPNQVAFRA